MLSELFQLFRGDIEIIDFVVQLCALLFVLLCNLPIHEFAHAKAAAMLGDDTARLSGRLTINPFAHLDPIGSVLMLVVGFGYAKPVPVNANNFKNPRVGMAITAFAGPLSNLIMCIIYCFLSNLVIFKGATSGSLFISAIYTFFFFAAYTNAALAVFNFLPVPPLDGSRIITLLIPKKYYFLIMQYEKYIMIGVLVLLFSRVLTKPLSFLTNLVMNLLVTVTSLPFTALG